MRSFWKLGLKRATLCMAQKTSCPILFSSWANELSATSNTVKSVRTERDSLNGQEHMATASLNITLGLLDSSATAFNHGWWAARYNAEPHVRAAPLELSSQMLSASAFRVAHLRTQSGLLHSACQWSRYLELWINIRKHNSDERTSWIFQHAALWLRRLFMIIADIAVQKRFLLHKDIDSPVSLNQSTVVVPMQVLQLMG